jgi:hypothetical protein
MANYVRNAGRMGKLEVILDQKPQHAVGLGKLGVSHDQLPQIRVLTRRTWNKSRPTALHTRGD